MRKKFKSDIRVINYILMSNNPNKVLYTSLE